MHGVLQKLCPLGHVTRRAESEGIVSWQIMQIRVPSVDIVVNLVPWLGINPVENVSKLIVCGAQEGCSDQCWVLI